MPGSITQERYNDLNNRVERFKKSQGKVRIQVLKRLNDDLLILLKDGDEND